MEGLLRDEVETGGDICGVVVNLAVEVANYAVLASFNAAKQVGLEAITLIHHDLLFSADSACTVAHRGMQQLLEGEVSSLNSSSTIDLSAAAPEHPSGTLSFLLKATTLLKSDDPLLCSADSIQLMFTYAGQLLTVSKKLHIRALVNPTHSTTRLLHQEPSAELSQHASDGSQHASDGHVITATTSASRSLSQHAALQPGMKSVRQLLSSSASIASTDVEHIVPKRYLTRGNQLVGGLFLHLSRKTSVTSCSPRFSQKLAHACFFETVAGNPAEGVCAWIGLQAHGAAVPLLS
jgi:hypothetical protein